METELIYQYFTAVKSEEEMQSSVLQRIFVVNSSIKPGNFFGQLKAHCTYYLGQEGVEYRNDDMPS